MLKRTCLYLSLLLFFSGCTFRSTPAPLPVEPLADRWARAELALTERRYGDAVKTLEEAALAYPANVEVVLRIGQIYLTQQRWILAEDAFNRALAVTGGTDARANAGLAETLLSQGRLPEAIKYWERAAKLDPQLSGVFTGLGHTRLRFFDFAGAREAFEAQQAHNPDSEAAWHLAALTAPLDLVQARTYLAEIPAEAAETDTRAASLQARRDYLAATLAPFDAATPQPLVARASGIALAQIGLWPLAVHALEIAVAAVPDDGEALAFLAHALGQAGKPALDLFEQARQLAPESALPSYLEGVYLRQQGAFSAAEVLFGRAISLDPDNAAAYAEWGKIKDQAGDLAAAEELYTTAVKLEPQQLEFQLLLLRFYANRSYRTGEAGIPLAERLIATNPDQAELHDLLGWMQFLSGGPDNGGEALQRAVELDPELVSARYHLARYLETNGQVIEAIAEYQRVADWTTSESLRQQALKYLQRLLPK